MKATVWLAALAIGVVFGGPAGAEEVVRLQEKFRVGSQYSVRTRVELTGTLTPPAVKGKPAPKPLKLEGSSAIEYDERVLALAKDGAVTKTLRYCGRMDFKRTVGGQAQQTSLRPAVRRLVLLRRDSTEVPFSPDGPLTWGEIDLVRTDVFAPALAGLLPDKGVRVGDRWAAAKSAVQELTDLERLDEGRLECKLEKVLSRGKRRVARVAFAGTVKGTNEDGLSRQRLEGHFEFDLGSQHLSALQLTGSHALLDKDGKEVGKVEGRFVLQRDVGAGAKELSDAAVKGLKLEPTADNTLLLYDNPDLGVRFLHPRRWKVAGVRGTQVALDSPDGSGLLLTVDPPAKVPTAEQFLAESRAWLTKQKAKLLKTVAARRLRASPALDYFALEAELGGQRFWMDYYVTRQAGGGATVAARLLPRDLEALRKEVEALARSVVVAGRK